MTRDQSQTPSPDSDKVLSYPTPPRKKPIPVWKHAVFVPLLLWVGAFALVMVAFYVWAAWRVIRALIL